MAIFVDGEKKCSKTTSGKIIGNSESLKIGCYFEAGSFYNLEGLIDEVRIYQQGLP